MAELRRALLVAVTDDLGAMVREAGLEAVAASQWREAMEAFERCHPHVVVAAAPAIEPELDGMQAPPFGETPLVVVGEATQRAALFRAGASELLSEPALLPATLERLLEARQAQEQPPPRVGDALLGSSPPMVKLGEQIARAARVTSTVLLRGETGTGKSLVARLIHKASARRDEPLVELNCAALPEQLLESELFGYERGAFTGASARKLGRVELAEGGTLFLDEIGDVSPATQVKLLRLLQDRSFERLGGVETLTADVRLIAATHQNLEGLIESGRFREDLFYRLNVVTLWVPPLRARRGDIADLARSCCAEVAEANGRGRIELDDEALALLRKQRWPGNVRQLENFVERLVVLGDGDRIGADDVKRELSDSKPFETDAGTGSVLSSVGAKPLELSEAVQRAEKEAIERALRHTRGQKKLAARLLGISRATLYNKLAEYEIG